MTRDELLTVMAKKESPESWNRQERERLYAGHVYGWNEYHQRRTELINKPPWGEAPEWAKWLAQDESGVWHWYAVKIGEPGCDDYEWGVGVDYSDFEQASTGTIPASHDWRDTLEKRPMDLYDAQDALANAWATGEARIDRIAQSDASGDHYAEDSDAGSALSEALSMPSKYHVRLKGAWCDVYDVLLAFGITNPADQHAIKKMLRPGQRGFKDGIQDRREAIQSLHRAIELEGGQ